MRLPAPRILPLDEAHLSAEVRELMPDRSGKGRVLNILLRAADELHGSYTIQESTWGALSAGYDEKQMMDLVFTFGQYTLVSMALNAFEVELDPGIEGFPR